MVILILKLLTILILFIQEIIIYYILFKNIIASLLVCLVLVNLDIK